MSERNSILFLSALDFKEKSIQVIRKTPEAYIRCGWNVIYLVMRDNSKKSDYYYEKVFNPDGVKVVRLPMPIKKILDNTQNPLKRKILLRVRGYLNILKIAFYAAKLLIKEKRVDVIYGYEIHGVLAANLLRLLGLIDKDSIVSRFQGTVLYEHLYNKNYLKLLLNWDHLLALSFSSQLCIMTDDGTRGDKVIELLRRDFPKNFYFWVNGVDKQKVSSYKPVELKKSIKIPEDTIVILSICRLIHWKRIDRCIDVIAKLVSEYNFQNFLYLVVGEGSEKKNLQLYAVKQGVSKYVRFTGAIINSDVKIYFALADYFMSFCDLSNVGNPLLEAIRAHKIIFTLNKGDTGRWIKHTLNGFIYNPKDDFIKLAAKDMYGIIHNKAHRDSIIRKIKDTEKKMLWSWEKRMNAEVEIVKKIFLENTS